MFYITIIIIFIHLFSFIDIIKDTKTHYISKANNHVNLQAQVAEAKTTVTHLLPYFRPHTLSVMKRGGRGSQVLMATARLPCLQVLCVFAA